jgi:hypothetical protein
MTHILAKALLVGDTYILLYFFFWGGGGVPQHESRARAAPKIPLGLNSGPKIFVLN